MQACLCGCFGGYVLRRKVGHLTIFQFVSAEQGSRLAYVDYAYDRATKGRNLKGVDIKVAYDATCAWTAKISERFAKHFPETKELVDRSEFSIDALHINDHLDKCTYLYSAAYQDCTGHFHGVGTEQYWSENNQMGPQTRQMNPGHRHDKIISHHTDWNWKKVGKHCQ